MSTNARKLSRYLGELESIYQQSVNLTTNYDNIMNLIAQSRAESREIGLDRNYINITESTLTINHQQLSLTLQGLYSQLCTFRNRVLVESDHMSMLVLGESLSNWTDQYNAHVVGASMNVATHIQNTYFAFNQQSNAGVVNV